MKMLHVIGAVALVTISACAGTDPAGLDDIELLEQDLSELVQDELTDEVRMGTGSDLLRGGGAPLFERLATAIPGFGGLYRMTRCNVAVVLTEDAAVTEALRIVHEALAPLVARTCGEDFSVEAVRGQFSYIELRRYLLASRPLHDMDGVLGAFIHIRRNRLAMVVVDRRAAAAVVRALPRVDIPREVVVFVRGAAARPAASS
jgi:hypothetical protein